MRVSLLSVTLALGFGDFTQEVCQTNTVLPARRWTDVVVKVLYCSVLILYYGVSSRLLGRDPLLPDRCRNLLCTSCFREATRVCGL